MLVMVRTTNTRRRRRRRSPHSSGPPPDDHRTNTSGDHRGPTRSSEALIPQNLTERRSSNDYAISNSGQAEPGLGNRAEDPEASGRILRRAADGEDGAGKQGPRSGVARVGVAIADRKRRPDWQPSGEGLGIDLDAYVRTGRSPAV